MTSELPLLALTLWPEWAWAICHLDKRVENRSWTPGPRLPIGSRLAIHAGKHIGGSPGALSTLSVREFNPDDCPKSAIVAIATIDGFDREQRTPWDVPGQWHWRLRDVEVLTTPIPCRGKQGLWAVPMTSEAEPVYQSRFVAYARVHGRTPEAQLAHDRTAWPGGAMCGFILWNSARWREWRTANGVHRDAPLLPQHHADYDRWLAGLPVGHGVPA